jgi:hypothetical protein
VFVVVAWRRRKFYTEELMEFIYTNFPVSRKREDNFICAFSHGFSKKARRRLNSQNVALAAEKQSWHLCNKKLLEML